MQPLRKADPSTLAGYRLLGRLGAGGMGVVFLARSAGGTLAALKLIRAEQTDPQGVIYAGMSPRRAALCARALREQGYRGPCGTVEYVLEPEFLSVAGPAAEGWYFGTGYVDPDVLPKARKFAAAYRKRWGLSGRTPVDRFATEAYDVTNWALQALRTAAVNHAESAASGVINGMLATSYAGITKTYLARSTKTTTTALAGLYLWQVKGGVPRCLGDFREAAAKGT